MSVIIKSGASTNLWTIDATAGAGRVTLYDAAGNVISNVTVGANTYAGASVQNVFVSTNNSSTVNLASGATFTGTSDSTLNIRAIQVNFLATQQCTIQVQQSNDAVNWDQVDSYILLANIADSRTFQATASNVRVLVTNNGGGATTTFRLQTVLAPIADVLPRALTTLGNLKVALTETTITKPSFSAATGAFTPPATPTDMFTITGSATRTVRILAIELSTTQTTAGINTFFVVKRSTANTAGTSTAVTAVPLDSTNAAATATALSYTANPTLGTLVGNVRAAKLLSPAAATTASGVYVWNFDSMGAQAVVLRGVAQVLAVNFAGAALPAGLSVACGVTWTEEV